jgi:protein-arginine deiminase
VTTPLHRSRRRAFLVGLALPGQLPGEADEHLDELAALADTAGADTVGRAIQARPAPDPKSYVGSGKAEAVALEVARLEADLVLVDDDLSGSQAKNLAELLKVDLLDRSGLILRIFEQRAAGAREIIGPRKGATFTFPDLLFPRREFGMEAVRYPGKDFDGLITITFTVDKGAAGTVTETAKVRVAPWMMPNHLDRAEKVFVVDMPGVNFPDTSTSPPGRFRDTNARYLTDLERLVSAAGCTLVKHPNRDQWMQDVMEFGFGNLPVSTGYRVVGRSPQDRDLAPFPKTLRAADFGYHEPGEARESTTFDSCGNLECTPPVTSKDGKKFPFGRMYFGAGRAAETMDADYITFLDGQIVQTPIRINTNWLFVGHVDEVISFVPAPGDKGFKLLLASPRVAYAILDANEAANGLSHMLVGRFFPLFREVSGSLRFVRWREGELAIQTFLRVGHPGLGHSAGDLRAFNDTVQGIIDSIDRQLQSDLGLEPSDIVHLPSIYVPNDDFPDQADALTAGVVNMLVLNKHCIVPKPFGPVVGGKDLFEEDVRAKLEPLGLTVNFLDDWFEYHVLSGEVHCSSNTLRAPKAASWWEFIP